MQLTGSKSGKNLKLNLEFQCFRPYCFRVSLAFQAGYLLGRACSRGIYRAQN